MTKEYPLLPQPYIRDPDELMDHFLSYVAKKEIELYPAQEEAILELFSGKNVILNTPTGSGKSLVAAALHFLSASMGKKSVYTCPIKALVNEKFLALCKDFGPENVGMMTGDATVNREAPILCCTAEILSNIALRDGAESSISDVIMDEFHYYSDPERGVAWQVPLITMERARFLLISATLGETRFFEEELHRVTKKPTVTVSSIERPVPLDFEYCEVTLLEALEELKASNKLPAYIVHFTQRSASETAQNLLSVNLCTKEEKSVIKNELVDFKFSSPFGKDIRKFLLSGIGLHHAGLLPKYRLLIEQMAQKGLLKVICGTDTLGVGVNVPIRTVLFTQLCKYSGSKTGILPARDFHQISGRAGRKGFDDRGYVVCLAPEHVVENKKLEAKAAADPKKKKKLVKRKPPERGFVNWDAATFSKLQGMAAEPLTPSFKVTHSMLLNVLSREGDGCQAMRRLIGDSHVNRSSKVSLRKQSFQLFRALLDREIVEFAPAGSDRKVRINIELQEDFSLNQALSLYCVDTLELLDQETLDYPLKVLTLVESILENPDILLRKQLDRIKTEKVAEMKAAGIEYEERMEKLETLEYPKPDSEFVYETFNRFAVNQVWIEGENVKPKSIAREMYERYSSFADYVKYYGLIRSEGLLLRHLMNVYRVLVHTIPPVYKSEAIEEVIQYLSKVLEITDSSLVDEWKRLQDITIDEKDSTFDKATKDLPSETQLLLRDDKATNLAARNEVFLFLRALVNKDFDLLKESYDLRAMFPDAQWPHRELSDLLDNYLSEHQWIRLDPEARNQKFTTILKDVERKVLELRQTLVDPDEFNDYEFVFEIPLDAWLRDSQPTLIPKSFGPIA